VKSLLFGAAGVVALASLGIGIGYGYAPSPTRPPKKVSVVLEVMVEAEPSPDPRKCVGGDAGRPKVMRDRDGFKWVALPRLLCRFRADGTVDQQWRVTDSRTATHKMQAAGGRIHFSRRVAPFIANHENSSGPNSLPLACSASRLAATILADNYVETGVALAPCSNYRSGNILLSTVTVPTKPVATPVLQFRRYDAAAGGKTILYLSGGPFEPALQGFGQNEILKYLVMERQDVSAVIVPLYAGTSYTYLEGVANFDVGIDQTSAVLDQLEAGSARNRVCVVGGSLGGRLGAHLAKRHPGTQFLLVNPLIWSAEDLRASVMKSDPAFSSRTVGLRRVNWREANGSNAAAQPQPTTLAAAFAGYFGPRFGERLGAVLGNDTHNVSIAYSLLDDRIGTASLAEVDLPPGQLAQMPEVGHEVGGYVAFWALQPHLKLFLDKCGGESR
jgi:pimeloyl-ACP methyl ester carboxylesterase